MKSLTIVEYHDVLKHGQASLQAYRQVLEFNVIQRDTTVYISKS